MAGILTQRAKSAVRAAESAFNLSTAALSPRRSWVRSQHRGAQSLEEARRVAVFVIFDAHSRIHDFVIAHLEGLARAGFATIAVVNSPRFADEARERLRPHTALAVHRINRGYDFGGYHDGLRLVPHAEDREGVLLLNDSTYGPFFDLDSSVFAVADPEKASMWALTDSWERRFHLQTYFLYATQKALRSRAWRKFWDGFLHLSDKRMVIERYEIGLTQHMLRHGLACEAVYPYRRLAESYAEAFAKFEDLDKEIYTPGQLAALRHVYDGIRSGVPMNASHFLWDGLLLEHRSPYLKRELLMVNPTGVPLAGYWEQALRSVSDYDTSLIDRHLKSVIRNRSP